MAHRENNYNSRVSYGFTNYCIGPRTAKHMLAVSALPLLNQFHETDRRTDTRPIHYPDH